uniref:Tryptophanyl-tRNA synthetase n=1 Tax=Stomoxys calcitrans TaxID=35570 RepID=A0A1I8Q102_STOCA
MNKFPAKQQSISGRKDSPPSHATLMKHLEEIKERPAHYLIQRKIYLTTCELDKLLTLKKNGEKFYAVMSHLPKLESLQLCHWVLFAIIGYLQDAIDMPLIIQTFNERSQFWNDLKGVIAMGLDVNKTFIYKYNDFSFMGQDFDQKIIRVEKCVTFNSVSSQYLLMPCAVDHDPYFRMFRNKAPLYGLPECGKINSAFLPPLLDTSVENSAIFLTDTSNQIADKITKYYNSKKQDGVTDSDILYPFLLCFIKGDLERSQDLKTKVIQTVTDVVEQYQSARELVDDKILHQLMEKRFI